MGLCFYLYCISAIGDIMQSQVVAMYSGFRIFVRSFPLLVYFPSLSQHVMSISLFDLKFFSIGHIGLVGHQQQVIADVSNADLV